MPNWTDANGAPPSVTNPDKNDPQVTVNRGRRSILGAIPLLAGGAALGFGGDEVAKRIHGGVSADGEKLTVTYNINRDSLVTDIKTLNQEQAQNALISIARGAEADLGLVKDSVEGARGKGGRAQG